MLGLYRAYYELCEKDEAYVGRVGIFIIADGYDKLTPEFLRSCTEAGIFNVEDMRASLKTNEKLPKDHKEDAIGSLIPRALNFYSTEDETTSFSASTGETNEPKKTYPGSSHLYGMKNVAHTFTNNLTMEDWKRGLDVRIRGELKVQNLWANDFLYGSPKQGKVKTRIY